MPMSIQRNYEAMDAVSWAYAAIADLQESVSFLASAKAHSSHLRSALLVTENAIVKIKKAIEMQDAEPPADAPKEFDDPQEAQQHLERLRAEGFTANLARLPPVFSDSDFDPFGDE